MVEGIRLGRDALVARFALSQRLVTRIGALLSRQVDVTASVLESARPGTAVEKVLLHPRVLTEAGSLTAPALAEVVAAVEGAGAPRLEAPLTVVVAADWRTVALEEEVMAATGWSRVPADAGGPRDLAVRAANVLPALAASPEAFPIILTRKEAAELFSPEELARLKLTILTGVEPKQKIEALRQLGLAPFPPEEKAALYLRALSDEDAAVRREAAQALRHLGLGLEVSEAICAVCEATPQAKPHALARLERILLQAPPQERQIALAVLLTELRNEKEAALQATLIRTLAAFADIFAQKAELLGALVQQVTDRLATQSAALAEPARALFAAIGRTAAGPFAALLWKEIERAQDRAAKAYYLELLCDVDLPDAERERLAGEIARCVAGWSDSDSECRRLAGHLKPFGAAGVRALLAAYPGAAEALRPFLLRTLDHLCAGSDFPARLMAKVGTFLLDVLATAKRPLRLTVLESRLYQSPTLPRELKTRLAADFISNVHEFRLDQVLDLTESALERLGIPAVEPLLRAAKGSPYDAERQIACKVLGHILERTPESGDEVQRAAERAIAVCTGLLDAGVAVAGPALRALGRVTASRVVPEAEAVRLSAILREVVRRPDHTCDALDALGWIAAGANTPLPVRLEIGMLHLTFLEEKFPEDVVVERHTGDGLVLEVSTNTAAYTDLIPVVVTGLERIALSPEITPMFREKVVESLVAKWYRTISYQVVWGPANVTLLGEVLGRIGATPETPSYLRVAVLKALKERMINMPVVESLGRVLSAPDDSDVVLELCEGITESIVGMTGHPDFSEREDREVILGALTRIAQRPRLARDARKSDALRRQVSDLVFSGLADEVPGTREMLERLAGCEVVAKGLRKAITTRLKKV